MLHHHAITVLAALRALIHDDVRDERGDVPGWPRKLNYPSPLSATASTVGSCGGCCASLEILREPRNENRLK